MDLLKVLAMPFQLASLLFVAVTSLVVGAITAVGGPVVIMGLFAFWLMLVWLTNYALHLIDDAANGVRDAQAASAEMMTNPFLDSRSFVHLLLAAALVLLHYLRPQLPVWPTLLVAVFLFPASLGACAMSGHALDAVNPLAIGRVMRGFGIWYLPLVAFMGGCALMGLAAVRTLELGTLLFATLQLLLLLAYAGLGGALYMRRFELGFEPRISPERRASQDHMQRILQRQRIIDGLYNDLRVRESQRAAAKAAEWFGSATPEELAGDVRAILEAGPSWHEPREYPRLLRALVPELLTLRQPALAFSVAEAGLAAAPAFAPVEEAHTVALVDYALHTGRRRAAAQLFANYLRQDNAPREPGPQLAKLRAQLLAEESALPRR
jgi:hypothetical protein